MPGDSFYYGSTANSITVSSTGVSADYYSSADCSSTGNFYNGSISSFQFYGYVLSPGEMNNSFQGNYFIYREETEKQKKTRLRLEKKEAKEEEKAEKTAQKLLKDFIGLQAFGLLYEVGYVELDSHKHKGRKYRIPKNHMAYIEIMDEEGKVVDTLCVHPAIDCPPADHILTRVAMIQNDEEVLLVAANHWGPREKSYYEN